MKPCDLSLEDDQWRIVSYINDLHPVHHRELYATPQEIININRCVQPWNECLAQWSVRWNCTLLSRVVFRSPLKELVVPDGLYDDRVFDWIDWKVDQWRKCRTIKLPEPTEFDGSKISQSKLDLAEKFGSTEIQVLVEIEDVFLDAAKIQRQARSMSSGIIGSCKDTSYVPWTTLCLQGLDDTNCNRMSIPV